MEHTVESQDEIWALLADPATHGGNPVRRIDTHAAAVFLAGDRVLKVKRAVRFPFLDFSSLERREAACRAELDVNRPFAAALYRRVVAITRETDGRLVLDGRGAPVEWAVEMVRFDEDATLDRLADRGEVDLALADALGRAVAVGHDAAPAVEAGPWIAAVGTYLDHDVIAFRETPDLFAAGEVAQLDRASRAALAAIRPLLAERGRQGLVRRGHGDLHLGNIALIGEKPVPFDAIEFDALIAAGDVLYDLAFLLMDLAERGLAAQANVVLNRYLAETRRDGDLDALAALPLFLSLRSAIRAKVAAARFQQTAAAERATIAAVARAYFDLAVRLIAPPPPRLVAVGGLSGTGKSVLARAVAPDILPVPGAVVLRSDVVRKQLFGAAETERLPAEAYRPEITAAVYAGLGDRARRVVAAGHSAVVDAVFADPRERAAIADVACKAQVTFRGLFLTADAGVRIARVGARVADASDADAAVAERQQHYDLGALDWTTIDAGGPPAETLRRARGVLG